MDFGFTSGVGIVAVPSTLCLAAAQIQRTTGGGVPYLALDALDSAAVAAFAADAEARFSCIDICVTNSGGPPSNFLDSTQPQNMRPTVAGGVVRSLT